MRERHKRLLWIGGAVAAVLVAAYILREPIRRTVIQPVYTGVQYVLLYVQSVPQAIYWMVLLVVAAWIAVRSFAGERDAEMRGKRRRVERPTRLSYIREWIQLADRYPYYRRKLALALSSLLLRSRGENVETEKNIVQRMESMDDVPEFIRVNISGTDERASPLERFWERLRTDTKAERERMIAELSQLMDRIDRERSTGEHGF